MEIIWKYFPSLSQTQRKQLGQLPELYHYWNQRINVISRKDIANIVEHHILHSLSVAKIYPLPAGVKVIDVGTGGGFPGIPLAILYPHTHFTLVDSVGKKIKVVNEIAQTIGLTNIEAIHSRVESLTSKYNLAISRAVADLPTLISWTKGLFEQNSSIVPPSLIAFKGDNVLTELSHIGYRYTIHPLASIFDEEYFHTKVLVQVFL